MRQQFNLEIEALGIAPSRIKYLSVGQNLEKYLTEPTQIAVLEAYPPNVAINQPGLEAKPTEDYFASNAVVAPESASALALFPTGTQPSIQMGQLNLGTYRGSDSSSPFLSVDCGCKIKRDGSYRLIFTGLANFMDISLPGRGDPFVDFLKTRIGTLLNERIARLSCPLKAEEVSALLQAVEKDLSSLFPGLNFCYLTDYAMDRESVLATAMKCGASNFCTLFTQNLVEGTADTNIECHALT